ncbi:uncharacterized protein LOC143029029 [Oratosquilla oratoria]|uniref:uncharacterized protein LOC143029029 n=1 Tax=Oratosquilla oratoria TaxID=337810 RepID=UPI003F76C034
MSVKGRVPAAEAVTLAPSVLAVGSNCSHLYPVEDFSRVFGYTRLWQNGTLQVACWCSSAIFDCKLSIYALGGHCPAQLEHLERGFPLPLVSILCSGCAYLTGNWLNLWAKAAPKFLR